MIRIRIVYVTRSHFVLAMRSEHDGTVQHRANERGVAERNRVDTQSNQPGMMTVSVT